jgi:hypothetical protein
MDIRLACDILGIVGEKITEKTIKKAYFKQALIWHPDKNKHPDSVHRFCDIQDAYIFLKSQTETDTDEMRDDDCDASLLAKFISITIGVKIDSDQMQPIIDQLKKGCEDTAFKLIAKLDKSKTNRIYNFIKNNHFIFGIDYSCVERMDKIVNTPIETLLLTPKIENLFNCDIYNLELDNSSSYYIPLWHDELEFRNDSSYFVVKIEPIMPDNVKIDDNNNVHIYHIFCIRELFRKETFIINIASREFIIKVSELFMKPHQIVRFECQGIPKVDVKNVFEVSNRGDVVVHIDLV